MVLNRTFLLLTVFILSSCGGTSDSNKDDIATIREFLSHAGEAVNSGNVEAEVQRFTEDGIYMWPGVSAIEGHDSLRAWFQRRFSEFEVDLESESLELQVFGDWAFERGRTVSKIRRRGSDEFQTVHGKYINILGRQPEGSWLISRRIRNSDHPMVQLQ